MQRDNTNLIKKLRECADKLESGKDDVDLIGLVDEICGEEEDLDDSISRFSVLVKNTLDEAQAAVKSVPPAEEEQKSISLIFLAILLVIIALAYAKCIPS